GDAGDLQRSAILLGSGTFIARFAQLVAGRNKALRARLLAALHVIGSSAGLISKARAAIIAALCLGVGRRGRGDQAGESERGSRNDREGRGKTSERGELIGHGRGSFRFVVQPF